MNMSMQLSISKRLFKKELLARCKLHDCFGACCNYGVWLDVGEKEKIRKYSEVVHSCMDPNSGSFVDWFEDETEDDSYTFSGKVIHSKIVNREKPFTRETCVFLRSDHKCALQVASEKIGEHPWFLKPFYCVLHPLDIDDNDQISLDETNILINEEKSCLRSSKEPQTPLLIFEDEIRYLLGDQVFENAHQQAEKLWKKKS